MGLCVRELDHSLCLRPETSPWLCRYAIQGVQRTVLTCVCVCSDSPSHPQAELICHFYVGETVLSIQKTTLIQGGSECLVYSTLSGSIGALVPFTSKEVGDHAE